MPGRGLPAIIASHPHSNDGDPPIFPSNMNEVLSGDLIYVLAFCVAGFGFALGPFVLVYFLAPRWTRSTLQKTGQAIECGMDPIGDAWIRYSVVYYLYALVFVAFAVDVLFLIPVAFVYGR